MALDFDQYTLRTFSLVMKRLLEFWVRGKKNQ